MLLLIVQRDRITDCGRLPDHPPTSGRPSVCPYTRINLRHSAITQRVEAATQADVTRNQVCDFRGHKQVSTLLIDRDELENRQSMIAALLAGKAGGSLNS